MPFGSFWSCLIPVSRCVRTRSSSAGSNAGFLTMSPSRSSEGARLADSADKVTVERSSEPPVSMLRAEPLLRLRHLLRRQVRRAFVEHAS